MTKQYFFRATSGADAQQIFAKRVVEQEKEIAFFRTQPDFTKEKVRDYYRKLVAYPPAPTTWVAYQLGPGLPGARDSQLLFVITAPQAEQHEANRYSITVYVGEVAKEFLASQPRA